MIHSLSRLLVPLLLLTPALAPAAPAQGRPEVAGNWLVRVQGPQPTGSALSDIPLAPVTKVAAPDGTATTRDHVPRCVRI